MKYIFVTFLTICIVSLTGQSASAEKISSLRSGNWKGGAYTNNNTGRFSHCAASVKYKSGILLLFSVTNKRRWNMGLSNNEWNLTPKKKYPVEYRVDRGGYFEGTAIAKSRGLVQVFLPTSDRLFRQFKNGRRLSVWAARQKMNFALTGTRTMLAKLLNCANFYIKRERRSRGRDNPFERNKTNPFEGNPSGPVKKKNANPFEA